MKDRQIQINTEQIVRWHKTYQPTMDCQLEEKVILLVWIEKVRDLTQSYDKSPYTNRDVKGQSDNTNNATSTITQRLRTDLERSVRVTTAVQMVWLTGLRSQSFHSPQQPWMFKGLTFQFTVAQSKGGAFKCINTHR